MTEDLFLGSRNCARSQEPARFLLRRRRPTGIVQDTGDTCDLRHHLSHQQLQPLDNISVLDLARVPTVLTRDSQRIMDVISCWLESKQPFILVGPEGLFGNTQIDKH